MRVAFIGLGVMGAPMAGHLAAAGHTVSVYNRSPAKAQAWAAAHPGTAAPTPAQAAQGAELVALCVGNDADVRGLVPQILPWPVDGQIGVVPPEGALALAVPEAAGLVEHHCGLAQGEEAVGEANRHPELAVIAVAQFRSHPLAEGGGAAADVDGDIEDFPLDAAHQLALGFGLELVVEAPQHATAGA